MDVQDKFVQLLDQVTAIQNKQTSGYDTVLEVSAILSDATKLLEKSEKPEEAVFDAKVLSASTNVLTNCVKCIDGPICPFDLDLFVESVLMIIDNKNDGNLNLAPLETYLKACSSHTVTMQSILGTFSLEQMQPKIRKERVARQAPNRDTAIKPVNVKVGEKQEDGIEDSLQQIMKVLIKMVRRNENQPVCYFQLVIDPDSFSASVENMYHVAFLVRDGIVTISLDEQGLLVISPSSKRLGGNNGRSRDSRPSPDSNQCVMSMNMDQWQEIVAAFDIKRARIPRKDRPAVTSGS